MKPQTRLLLAALVLTALLTGSGSAQISGNTDCNAAKAWHLQQAMKINLAQEQDYHLGAADAAGQLASMSGSPCAMWKQWADGREGWVAP